MGERDLRGRLRVIFSNENENSGQLFDFEVAAKVLGARVASQFKKGKECFIFLLEKTPDLLPGVLGVSLPYLEYYPKGLPDDSLEKPSVEYQGGDATGKLILKDIKRVDIKDDRVILRTESKLTKSVLTLFKDGNASLTITPIREAKKRFNRFRRNLL